VASAGHAGGLSWRGELPCRLQHYLARFANGNADTDGFFASLADTVHDPRVLAGLRSFVDQPGVPVINFTRPAAGYRVSKSRYAPFGTTAAPQRCTVPVCYRADAARACLMLDGLGATIAVSGARMLMPHAGGMGYYRFSLPEEDWCPLIATSASLSPAEALMTTDSLWAGFAAGEIDPGIRVFSPRVSARVSTGCCLRFTGLCSTKSVSKSVRDLIRATRPNGSDANRAGAVARRRSRG